MERFRNTWNTKEVYKSNKICNEKTMCKVRFLPTDSEPFGIKSGTRQGAALSSTLFNLDLEKII